MPAAAKNLSAELRPPLRNLYKPFCKIMNVFYTFTSVPYEIVIHAKKRVVCCCASSKSVI